MSNFRKMYTDADVLELVDLLGDLKSFSEDCKREDGFIFGKNELPVLISLLEDFLSSAGGVEGAY